MRLRRQHFNGGHGFEVEEMKDKAGACDAGRSGRNKISVIPGSVPRGGLTRNRGMWETFLMLLYHELIHDYTGILPWNRMGNTHFSVPELGVRSGEDGYDDAATQMAQGAMWDFEEHHAERSPGSMSPWDN